MTLDETIEQGQAGHLADHNVLHDFHNDSLVERYNVKVFGAVGDGATDDTAAIQAAIDAAEVAGGQVFVPPVSSYYLVTNLTAQAADVQFAGVGAASHIRSDSDHVFDLAGTPRLTMRDLHITAAASAKACLFISGTVSRALFENVTFSTQHAAAYALFATGSGWKLLDSMFLMCEIDADSNAASVPVINLIDTVGGICNQNTWLGGRWTGHASATAPIAYLSCQASNYMYGNTFQGINIEIPTAGAIHLEGHQNAAIRDVGMYDLTTATDHMIIVGKHASGLESLSVFIENTLRISGTISTFYDIHVLSAFNTTIINSGAQPPNTGKIDLNGAKALILNPQADTIDADTFAIILSNRTDEIQLRDSTRLRGSGTPESAVTAPVGSIFLRTDGGAGTTLYVKESGTGDTGWIAK